MRSDAEHTLMLAGDSYQHTMQQKRVEGMPGGEARTTKTNGRFLGADCKAHGARTMEEMMKAAEQGMPPRERRPAR